MNLKSLLQQLDLSEKATECYLVLIKQGTSSASELSDMAKLNRSSTYSILDELIDTGLATSYDDHGVTKYTAEAPLQLIANAAKKIHLLEEQKSELNKFTETIEVSKKERIKKPTVRYFEGKKGFSKILEECLTVPKESHIHEITNHELCRKFFLKELDIYNRKMRKTSFSTKSISQGSLRGEYDKHTNKFYNESPIRSEIAVFKNQVSFVSLTEESKSFIVQHKDISTTYESLYKLAFGK